MIRALVLFVLGIKTVLGAQKYMYLNYINNIIMGINMVTLLKGDNWMSKLSERYPLT